MKEDRKTARMVQIEEAAYALIADKGYASTSMLTIAKRAKASNETLYSWYGDKLGLFARMVERNANEARAILEEALEADADPLEALNRFGTVLLGMLFGERAIALNRAAAADISGQLGAALARSGRNAVAPLIGQTLDRARQAGLLHYEDTADATDLYLGLLIGDLQLRCVTGQITPPGREARDARARRTAGLLRRLLG